MKYLVIGGAGYIGSHLSQLLYEKGHTVTVFDNLSTGHASSVTSGIKFINGNIENIKLLQSVLSDGPWEAVFHFAALSIVGDSMKNPYGYFRQNAFLSLGLIQACVANNIKKFIFSSTAALFGNPISNPINENAEFNPLSPYGESKLMVENMLKWSDKIHGMKYACLRYFNASGCHSGGLLGEIHTPETHLIPLIIDTALGRRKCISVFGTDYDTPDGSAIRDYIHVTDLAEAHILASDAIGDKSVSYNLGTGTGYSVLDIINTVEEISGYKVSKILSPRRAGDPAMLIACPKLIKSELGWDHPQSSLDNIIRTTLEWRKNNPNKISGINI